MKTHDTGTSTASAVAVKPQSVMLSFLGLYVLDAAVAVYSGSIIDVFARVDVSEEAVRSTLARMVRRGMLCRHRRGRRMYFGLTARSTAVLQDGHRRVWHSETLNHDWDGTWTMVGFSLPEPWRSRRHDLRSRLVWGGFGPLQSGLWIAPGPVDVPALLGDLDLDAYLNVFSARTGEPTEDGQLVRAAFDTDAIAARYREFLDRWDRGDPLPGPRDDLARALLLHTDWLHLVRSDPRLPATHLPPDWPAIRAERVFRELAARYRTPADRIAASVLDTIAVPAGEEKPG